MHSKYANYTTINLVQKLKKVLKFPVLFVENVWISLCVFILLYFKSCQPKFTAFNIIIEGISVHYDIINIHTHTHTKTLAHTERFKRQDIF